MYNFYNISTLNKGVIAFLCCTFGFISTQAQAGWFYDWTLGWIRSGQSKSPALAQGSLEIALGFIASPQKSVQNLGWVLLDHTARTEWDTLEKRGPEFLNQLEKQAVQANTIESNQYLVAYYQKDKLKRSALLSDLQSQLFAETTNSQKLLLVILAEGIQSITDPMDPLLTSVKGPHLDEMARVFRDEGVSIKKILLSLSLNNRPHLHQKVQELLSDQGFVLNDLMHETLTSCLNYSIQNAYENGLSRACSNVLNQIEIQNMTGNIFSTLAPVQSLALEPVMGGHLTSQIAIDPRSSLSNNFHFPEHSPHCRYDIFRLSFSGNSTLPVQHFSSLWNSPRTNKADWDGFRCLNYDGFRNAWDVFQLHACFAPFSGVYHYPELGGITSYGAGFKTRTKNHNLVTGEGSGRVYAGISVSYHPTPATNWMAIRRRDIAFTSEVACKVGCLSSPGFNRSFIERDPNFGWNIVRIRPGIENVQFGITHAFRFNVFKYEHIDDIEMLEFSSQTSKKISHVPLTHLNVGRSGTPGLLSYIASIQHELRSKGWLLPESPKVEGAALSSLARLNLLYHLANLNLSGISTFSNINPGWYPSVQWRERQEFLRNSTVLLAYRIFENYNERLGVQIQELEKNLSTLESLSKFIREAIQAKQGLTNQKYFEIFGKIKNAYNLFLSGEPDPLFSSTEQLNSALNAAYLIVVQAELEARERKMLSCNVLRQIQPPQEIKEQFPEFKSSSPILEACSL